MAEQRSESAQQIRDRGDTRLDRALADIPEAEDELRRGRRGRRPLRAHSIEANQTLARGRDDCPLVGRIRQVRHGVEASC